MVQSRIENEDINSEYIFVLDCSGKHLVMKKGRESMILPGWVHLEIL